MTTLRSSSETKWEGSSSHSSCTLPFDELPEINFSNSISKGRILRKKTPKSRTDILADTIDLTQAGQMEVADDEMDLTQDDDNQGDHILPLRSNIRKKKKDVKSGTENKKQKSEKAKPTKQATGQKNKIHKPGDCMKHMCIEMHPALAAAWYMGDVAREARAAGARARAAPALRGARQLAWARAAPQANLMPTYERCERALYVACAAHVAEHVGAHTLAEHIALEQDTMGCALTLVIFGVKDYFKTSGRKTCKSGAKLMTEIDLEMAITDLLVSAGCDTVIVNTPNELALLIVQFTKAIAEAPYKKEKRAIDEQADFYMRGDNKKSVAVDKDGNGVGRLWQQMIAVLPMSSLETSRAVCAQYQSPVALYEALQSRDGLSILADVGVSRAAVPGARARRLGPEFARKLHTLFTADDGNTLVE